MKKIGKIGVISAVCVIGVIVLWTWVFLRVRSWGDTLVESKDEKIDQTVGEEIVKKKQGTKAPDILDISCEKDIDGKPAFSISIDDFIRSYNSYYRLDMQEDYLEPCTEWYCYTQDFGKHKDEVHYEFTADKKIWTLPTITIFTMENEKQIRELTVNFDDHSYSDEMYEKYEEMCFYTLCVFFPNKEKKELVRLYKELNKLAYKHIFQNEQGFDSGNPPTDLFYNASIGIYPYFAYGESVRLCIVPVTQDTVKQYKKRGTKIHKI